MRVTTAQAFHPNGRIRGSYVYMLMCQTQEAIHIKVGISDDPLARLRSLRADCQIEPGILAIAELPNRRMALNFEQELRCVLARWRNSGEWLQFESADKADFNASIQSAAVHFSKPAWPIRWQKLSVPALIAEGRWRQAFIRFRSKRRASTLRDHNAS